MDSKRARVAGEVKWGWGGRIGEGAFQLSNDRDNCLRPPKSSVTALCTLPTQNRRSDGIDARERERIQMIIGW